MRGMLSFQILWLLSKGPMHGEEMAKELERRRGEKPKAGTIYPALKELRNHKLIEGKREGKTIVYHITPEGRMSAKHSLKYFVRCFGDMFEG
ncbi:MAG: PadR family transcriptional regulator [Candidatus Micrarchaeota archaeon]|nr:PadR family transcriptional regulator [Candidatus Micrarchaeota archaeon]